MEIVKLVDKWNSKNRYAYTSDWQILDCMLEPVYKIENANQLKELINMNSSISTQNWLSIVLLYRINGKREPKWHNVLLLSDIMI